MYFKIRLSASKEAVNLDYLTTLRDSILKPLIDEGSDGVQKSLDFMNHYHLVKDDLESLNELSLWPGNKDPMSNIPAKVKSAFTRAYNKSAPTFNVTKKNKNILNDNEGSLDIEEVDVISDEEVEEDDITNDSLISVVNIYIIQYESEFVLYYFNNLTIIFQVKKKTGNKGAPPRPKETSKGKGGGGRKKK